MISLGRAYRLHGDAKNSLRYLDMAVQVTHYCPGPPPPDEHLELVTDAV